MVKQVDNEPPAENRPCCRCGMCCLMTPCNIAVECGEQVAMKPCELLIPSMEPAGEGEATCGFYEYLAEEMLGKLPSDFPMVNDIIRQDLARRFGIGTGCCLAAMVARPGDKPGDKPVFDRQWLSLSDSEKREGAAKVASGKGGVQFSPWFLHRLAQQTAQEDVLG